MKVERERIELAALLDGEIQDAAEAGRLAELLSADAELRAEFEVQRQVKSLLASLPEHPTPVFISTRVLGEIAARRRRRPVWFKPVLATASALLAMVIGLTVATQQFAGSGGLELHGADPGSEAGFTTVFASEGSNYKPQDWRAAPAPEGVTDERILDFIEFAREAHVYKRLMRSTHTMSPDIAEAILVLEREGN